MKLSIRAAAVAALLAGLSAPALAQPADRQLRSDQPAVSQARPVERAEESRRICVRTELTGSRLTRTVCRTAEEWQRAGGIPTEQD
jgi:hypothetical protein